MARLVHTALVAIVLAAAVSGCSGAVPGSGSGAATAAVDTVSADCAAAVGKFVDALKSIDSRLDIGLSFTEYGDQLGTTKAAYDDVKWSALAPECTGGVGVDAEAAMNHYIKAYGRWNDCIKSTSCKTDSIQGDLQTEWSAASDLIDKIRARLP